MRVALNVEQLLYPSPGGVGRYTAQLAKLTDPEMVPFVARHPQGEIDAALARFDIHGRPPVVEPLPRPLLYEAWHLLGHPGLRVGPVDVVHAPSVAVPPKGRAPLIVTVHDAAPELYPEAFPRRGLRFHRQGLAATARRADLVITVSQAAADEIIEHAGIPAARVRVVHNGVDAPRLDPGRVEAARVRLGVADRPYVLWVGSLEPRKNVRTLVAAWARARLRARTRPRLVLAGYPGWLSDEIVERADRVALGADLVELGRVDEEDLWALHAGACLLAFPSVHEGFGFPVIEAMAVGTPVLCADIPVLREVAGDAAAGYVPATDVSAWAARLTELLAEPTALEAAGRAGPARAGGFSVATHLAATRTVYAEAAGWRAPRS